MTLNLKRIRYFTVVAEELHFGRAAERLHMAQPPLSQQIRQLETDLGVELFSRSTRRVKLTEAGTLFYPQALKLITDAEGLERRLAQYSSGDGGRLRIGFVDSSSYEVMPRFLRAYRARWPAVEYELRSMSSDEQYKALTRGEIDLGIARANRNPQELKSTLISKERLILAMPVDHKLANQKRTSISQLQGEEFLGFDRDVSPSLHTELTALFSNHQVVYDPIIEATEYTTILGLVASGQGIAIVPAGVQTFSPPNLRYVGLRNADATSQLLLLSRQSEQSRLVTQASSLIAEGFTLD